MEHSIKTSLSNQSNAAMSIQKIAVCFSHN